MPRIETIKVLPFLWIGWQEHDHGYRSHMSRGLTREAVIWRVSDRIQTEQDKFMEAELHGR